MMTIQPNMFVKILLNCMRVFYKLGDGKECFNERSFYKYLYHESQESK
jgi:hypothetical protein